MSEPSDIPPGWYANGSGQQQWWDGEKWGPLAPEPATPMPRLQPAVVATKPDPIVTGVKFGCLGIIIFFVVIFIWSSALSNTPEGRAENEQADALVFAESACETAVTNKLKSPSSARFVGTKASGSGTSYRVSGEVDAQNSFGAEIRSYFVCKVTVAGGDVSVQDVSID